MRPEVATIVADKYVSAGGEKIDRHQTKLPRRVRGGSQGIQKRLRCRLIGAAGPSDAAPSRLELVTRRGSSDQLRRSARDV